MARTWSGRSCYQVFLRRLEAEEPQQLVGPVLAALGGGIRRTIERTEQLPEDHPRIDDDCDLIEEYLGAAFVVCQVYITAIVTGSLVLQGHFASQNPGELLAGIEANKRSLLRQGGKRAGVAKVELIDAMANCYKHRDEWSGPNDIKRAKGTIATIQQAGVALNSTGTMRKAAERLGNRGYDKVLVFEEILGRWKDALVVKFRGDLQARGLIRRP